MERSFGGCFSFLATFLLRSLSKVDATVPNRISNSFQFLFGFKSCSFSCALDVARVAHYFIVYTHVFLDLVGSSFDLGQRYTRAEDSDWSSSGDLLSRAGSLSSSATRRPRDFNRDPFFVEED